MGLPVYNSAELRIQRFYFTGTETLVAGQPLCFQESPATASVTKGFAFDVEIPNSANRRVFAGIPADDSVGIQGPAYINVIVPRSGDFLSVLVSRAADIAAGAVLKLNHDLDTTTAAGVAGFDALVVATEAGSVAGSVSGAAVATALAELPGLCMCLVSVASTATNNTRTLTSVKFL